MLEKDTHDHVDDVTIHSREMKGHGKNTMLESVF